MFLLPVAALAQQRQLFIHGLPAGSEGPSPLWLVRLDKIGGADRSFAMVCDRPAENNWQELSAIHARVTAITAYHGELVMLLRSPSPTGLEWALYSPASEGERYSSGAMLPGDYAIVAMAGDQRDLYALGRSSAPPAPTTASSTRPSSSDEAGPPELYMLKGNGWSHVAARWTEPPPARGLLDGDRRRPADARRARRTSEHRHLPT